jgi:hypothetical protein
LNHSLPSTLDYLSNDDDEDSQVFFSSELELLLTSQNKKKYYVTNEHFAWLHTIYKVFIYNNDVTLKYCTCMYSKCEHCFNNNNNNNASQALATWCNYIKLRTNLTYLTTNFSLQ